MGWFDKLIGGHHGGHHGNRHYGGSQRNTGDYAPQPAQQIPAGRACQACGSINGREARFCGDCGKGLAQPTICAGCSTPLERGARFCAQCGKQAG